MSRYSEMNADERTADIEERTQDTHDTEAARADEQDRISLEDGSYCAYWLNRVIQ